MFALSFFFSQHPKMRDESERKVIQIDADGKQIVVFKCETCEKPFFTAAQLSGNLRQKTSEMLTCTFFFLYVSDYPFQHTDGSTLVRLRAIFAQVDFLQKEA